MRDAFVKCLIEYAEQREKFCLITADLGFGVFDEYSRRFPDQFLNVGVAEQNMAAIAAGMALEGWKIVMYSIGNFPTFRCLEQIRNDICYHDLDVKVIGMGGGFSYGILGMSHHATEDIAIMRALPNMKIYAPSGAKDAHNVVKAMLGEDGPCYLRLDKSSYDGSDISDRSYAHGKAVRILQGNDVTLVSTGSVLEEVVQAAELLREHGVSAEVLSYSSIRPFDEEQLGRSVRKTGYLVSIEEHSVTGGLGSVTSEVVLEAGWPLKGFRRVGLRDTFSKIVGDTEYLRKQYGMDADSIVDCVIRLMGRDIGLDEVVS